HYDRRKIPRTVNGNNVVRRLSDIQPSDPLFFEAGDLLYRRLSFNEGKIEAERRSEQPVPPVIARSGLFRTATNCLTAFRDLILLWLPRSISKRFAPE